MEDQYVKVNVIKENSSVWALKTDIRAREKGRYQEIPTNSEYQVAINDTNDTFKPIVISKSMDLILMKGNN